MNKHKLFRPVTYGFVCALIGGIGILNRGLGNLSKGEASSAYTPSFSNNMMGYVFSVLFWGGILLIILGLVIKLFSKAK